MEQQHTFLIPGSSWGLGSALTEFYAMTDHLVFGCARSESDLIHDNYHHAIADMRDGAPVRDIFNTINTPGLSVVADTGMSETLDDKALKEKQGGLVKSNLIDADEGIHAIDFLISENVKSITNQIIYFGGIR